MIAAQTLHKSLSLIHVIYGDFCKYISVFYQSVITLLVSVSHISSSFSTWLKAGKDGSSVPTLFCYDCLNTTSSYRTLREVEKYGVAIIMQVIIKQSSMGSLEVSWVRIG